jgi:hypothetical protein
MKAGATTQEQFVEAVSAVMLHESISLETFMDRTPRGFWEKVGKITGQKDSAAQVYWSRRKADLLSDLEARLANVDEVDEAQEVLNQAALETAKVDIVDQGEGSPSDVKAANVDISEESTSDKDANLDQESGTQEPAVKSDKVAKRELESMLQALELRLTTLIDHRIKETIASTSKAVIVDNLDMPPVPPKVGDAGKRFAGSKADLRARVDLNLFKLLEGEAREHFSGNMSRCLDALLWRYYDRPKLSFEE